MRVRDLLDAAGRRDPASVRMLASAHASHRRALPAEAARRGHEGRGRRRARARGVEAQREAAAGRHEVPRARHRRAERQRRAAISGLHVGAGIDGEADLSGLRAAVDQGRVAVLYVVDPGPDGSMGDLSGWWRHEGSGRLPVLIYQGVSSTALVEGRRRRAAGRGVGGEGRHLHERSGPRAGRLAGHQPAGRSRRGLADPHQRRRRARTALHLHDLTAGPRRRGDLHVGPAGVRGPRRNRVQPPGPAEHWLQASNPMERWKWNTMFQDLPPVKGHNVQMEGPRRR